MQTTRTPTLAGLTALALVACGGGEDRDSSARDLTLAPAETTTTMRDVPAPAAPAAPAAKPAPPRPRPETPKPKPPAPRPPAAPASRTLASGTSFGATVHDTITTRSAKVGDTFTASIASDVRDASGRVVVPAGTVVRGSVLEVAPAPNPSAAGTMRLTVTAVTINGRDYPLVASIDSIDTVRQGRGIEGADAAKVGAGAAAGAIAGRIIGKNKKGTVIGGIVGAAAGAGVAAKTKDVDLVLPAGARIIITLLDPLIVRTS